MVKKNKFLFLIEQLDIKKHPALDNGEIDSIIINKEQGIWEFNFTFDTPLPLEILLELDSKLKNMMSSLRGVNKVITNYNYKNKSLNEITLKNYWEYFLNKLAEQRKRLNILHEVTVNYFENKITYLVANQDEVEMVYPLTLIILEELNKYGLDIEVNVEISPFETPFSHIILETIRNSTEEILQQIQQEERVNGNNNNDNQPVFKQKPRGPRKIDRTPVKLCDVPATEFQLTEYRQKYNTNEFVIEGEVFSSEITEVKGGYKIYTAIIYDGTDSIMIKSFLNKNNLKAEEKFYNEECCAGKRIRAFGNLEYDNFARDIVLMFKDIQGLGDQPKNLRKDTYSEKRVELHAHSKMSVQDGVMEVKDYVNMALHFGHTALAITDHNNIHAHPEFCKITKKLNIKPIYGLEGNLVDENHYKIALTNHKFNLNEATYVVYDLETTGLSARFNEIIEIAAVKIRNGLIVDEFSTYVKPNRPISAKITELTSITNDDVRNAPPIEEVLPQFYRFIEGCVLVAHNALFDNNFIFENLKRQNIQFDEFPSIDTLQIARVVYGDKLKRFNLRAVAKFFDVELEQHHRAIYDAKTTSLIFLKMLNDLSERGIEKYEDINTLIDPKKIHNLAYAKHVTILSKNCKGQKALNQIVSISHTETLAHEPTILKSFLSQHRENLLIGSGCSNGEVWDTAFNLGYEKLLEVAKFYDFLEVQPPSAYEHLVEESGEEITRRFIKETIKDIIRAGKELGIPVVATGDVHHLEKEDVLYRDIYIRTPISGGGLHPLSHIENIPPLYFMTTDEMMQAFKFLDDDIAYEIVITNSNKIANQIEKYDIFPSKLYTPRDDFFKDRGVPSFKEEVKRLTYQNAHRIYGQKLPAYVEARIEKELKSIINNDFASIYYISHILVAKSKSDGYVVGSRGSVGSSFVATLMEITEVNPLAPHYVCPKCHFSAFKLNESQKQLYPQDELALQFEDVLQSVDTGYDLPDANCPRCGEQLVKDGVDIPFETFLGFEGDKIPDIDLNFSSDYQNKVHEFCREIFGADNTFRAGTISTVASKLAYNFIKDYFNLKGIEKRNAEKNRIIEKIIGVKRSTGQHPGGIIVVPDEIKYYDIIPVQYPADDKSSTWRTSHYDYHSFEANLLKLDILGHDDPTMIRKLMDFVEENPEDFPFKTVEEIPITDPKVLKLFTGVEVLGLRPEQVFGEEIGTTGIPEFGTNFTKDMLRDIRPKTFSDLLKVSGLSHGTDVWGGNQRDLLLGLKEGVPPVPFKELIGCRDDIMTYLIKMNLPPKLAFQIMESVRKGNGLTPAQEKEMQKHNVPQWYIDSCKLIKYMFPKAHATAYVIMALRIAWFKVHRPIYYYAAYFSRRTDAFDIKAMAEGKEAVRKVMQEIDDRIKKRTASNKDPELFNTLLLALEMLERGYRFEQIDIYRSEARDFIILPDKKTLLIPFSAMDSLGESTALSIVEARNERMFTSKQDVLNRTKINTTLFERLNAIGAFKNLPDNDQIGLF